MGADDCDTENAIALGHGQDFDEAVRRAIRDRSIELTEIEPCDFVRHSPHRLSHGDMLERLRRGIQTEGWRFVAFVRLVPLFPYNLLNYALGLTPVKWSHYLVASAICMVPGDIAYVYLGYASQRAVQGDAEALRYGLLALAALATLAYLPRLVSLLRDRRSIPRSSDP